VEIPHNVSVYKLLEGDDSYVLLSAFKDIDELTAHMKEEQKNEKASPFVKIDDIHHVSYTNVLKHTQILTLFIRK